MSVGVHDFEMHKSAANDGLLLMALDKGQPGIKELSGECAMHCCDSYIVVVHFIDSLLAKQHKTNRAKYSQRVV